MAGSKFQSVSWSASIPFCVAMFLCITMLSGCCQSGGVIYRPTHEIQTNADSPLPPSEDHGNAEELSNAEAEKVVMDYLRREGKQSRGFSAGKEIGRQQLWDQLTAQAYIHNNVCYVIQYGQVVLEISPAPDQWCLADLSGTGHPQFIWMSCNPDKPGRGTACVWFNQSRVWNEEISWNSWEPKPILLSLDGKHAFLVWTSEDGSRYQREIKELPPIEPETKAAAQAQKSQARK